MKPAEWNLEKLWTARVDGVIVRVSEVNPKEWTKPRKENKHENHNKLRGDV